MEVKRYACNICQCIMDSDAESRILNGYSFKPYPPALVEFSNEGQAHVCFTCAGLVKMAVVTDRKSLTAHGTVRQ